MPLYINTNVSSLNAQRNLLSSTSSLQTSFSRLSSGLRITRAKDDAAGLAISNRMTAQIRGLNQAIRNANDGISLSQVAEGALEQTTNALQRIRELAVQSANDTNHDSDRWDLQKEVNQLLQEIERISRDTEFNSTKVLDGTYSTDDGGNAARFHIGANENQYVEVEIAAADVNALLIDDTDGAISDAVGTGVTVPGILYPFDANGDPVTGWDVENIHSTANLTVDISNASGRFASGAEAANRAIAQLDVAIGRVNHLRSTLGAVESRFDSAISNLSNVVENVSGARSRVLDADIAAETSRMTQQAILQQAGTAILAQANQQPQLALQLLG
ncbi:MAG: flagellin FliC [Magnetococcus sp. WYHC-3]